MKKIITLSLVAATLLFTGCGEDTEKTAAEATAKVVESTKEAASTVVDTAKKEATKAVEVAKEATTKAVETTKEAVTAVVADTVKNVAGAAAYAKCAGCHGVDGKTKALGKSAVIAGQSKADLVTKMNGYKAGTINVAGMGNLMKGQVASMDDASIEAVSTFISTMK